MEACPRNARIPPPGRPILPNSNCKIAAVRMICTPFECALLRVPSGEIAVLIVFRITIFVAQNTRSVRVMNDVIAKKELIFNQVSDETAEEDNVSSRAERHPDVRERARAREPRIDVDDRGALFLRFHHPAKTDRMRFSHRAAFDQKAIGVGEILLRGRSAAPAEGAGL